uniref:Non-structural protein NS2 n=1 Tax=Epizootic hemorrhagic disease virus 2 TaxID=33721 RepID=Q8BES7_9REOV|nr:nonstructural protein 2 [Epizootic hemorrhagic disease virus 2]
MEQKQRRFTKNVFVLDQKRKTICGQIASKNAQPYCQIKIGRNFALKAVATPEPKGYVLEISEVGSYRIQDGSDIISLMISADGVEATTERWEEWKFETDLVGSNGYRIGYKWCSNRCENKISKGMGMVPPYTRNDFARREIRELPGVQKSKYDVKELRQKIREEREKGNVELQLKPTFKAERGMNSPDSDEDQNPMNQMADDWAEEVRKQDEDAARRKALETKLEDRDEDMRHLRWRIEGNRRNLRKRQRNQKKCRDRKKEPQLEEVIVEDEGEESGEEETVSASYITSNYIERISKIRKSKDERLSMLASMMPQQSGEFTSMLFTKKIKWDNVPLYLIDEVQKKYELQSVGGCDRVAFVSKGTNLIILPVASKPR